MTLQTKTNEQLVRLFDLSHRALLRNLAGIDHRESLQAPQPAGNCLNWVLGHILASRHDMLLLFESPLLLVEASLMPYRRGSKPLIAAEAWALEDLLTALEATQDRLRTVLGGCSEGDLQRREGKQTRTERLLFYYFHEAYHTGQIALLRRLLDKEGAIP